MRASLAARTTLREAKTVVQAHWRPLVLLVLLVLAANAPILSGYVTCDPETFYMGLNLHIPDSNVCFQDPAVALYTQPFGALAAQDWLHGIIPWWTPYTGAGMPLAAEVQDEAFFLPFVLLLKFQSGWFIQRLLFQLLCGLFTYALLRKLGLGAASGLLGGALYALNGTFYLNPGTVCAPLLFLPLLLIAVERAYEAAAAGQGRGWGLLPLAVAGSIYAGFPEVAFFQGLLGAAWAALRFFQLPAPARWRFAGKMAAGGCIGLALTAPMVVPFFEYLRLGDIGLHHGFMANVAYPPAAAPLQMLPLFFGAISHAPPAALQTNTSQFPLLWGDIGGWFGCAPVFLALAAVLMRPGGGRPERGLRWFLAAWVVLWEARFFGVPGITRLVNVLPGVGAADTPRYAPPTLEFALFLLAAWGLDDVLRRGRARQNILLPLAAFLLCLVLSILPALQFVPAWFKGEPGCLDMALAAYAGAAVTVLMLAYALRTGAKIWLAQGLILAGSVLVFMLPELGGLRNVSMDFAGIAYLQKNAGLNRMVSLGPIAYNTPAQWGIASVSSFQLPSPRLWDDYVARFLLGLPPGPVYGLPSFQQLAHALQTNSAGFAASGVKYIAVWPFFDPLAELAADTPPAVITRLATGPAAGKITLEAGQSVQGVAALAWAAAPIYAVSLNIGTYHGGSSGPLRVDICAAGHCAYGQRDLSTATDDAEFFVPLEQPLAVPGGAVVTYRILHPAGAAVAVWLAATKEPGFAAPGLAPLLGFQQSPPQNTPVAVLHSPTTTLYALPYSAPYAEASRDDCNFVIRSRTRMQSNCPSPATLTRREEFYPGWHALVNGVEAPVSLAAGTFQSLPLPAGPAIITFFYRPTHTSLSGALALAALLLWLAGMMRRRV